MSGVTPPHCGDGAQLRKPEAVVKPFVLVADKAIVEIDVMCDEDAFIHEPHKAVGDVKEHGRIADHLVRDARDLRYLCWNGALRI